MLVSNSTDLVQTLIMDLEDHLCNSMDLEDLLSTDRQGSTHEVGHRAGTDQ